MQIINPATLKQLRAIRNMTQEHLVKETKGKVSLSTIKRIECTDGMYNAIQRVAKQLASALQVDPADLSKDFDDIRNLRNSDVGLLHTFKVRIGDPTAQSILMVELLYGISAADQVRMMPLFVAILAEKSLDERKNKLEELYKISEILFKEKGHLSFAQFSAIEIEDHLMKEQNSIDTRDIFAKEVSDASFVADYNPYDMNPFAEYLRKFAGEIKAKHIQISDDECGEGHIPDFEIGKDKFEEITGGDKWAKFALTRDYAKIGEIPEKLMSKEARDERVKWLAGKIPDSVRKKQEDFEEQMFGPILRLTAEDLCND